MTAGPALLTLDRIPEDLNHDHVRVANLSKIVDYVAMQRTCGARSELIFICTHNSRRSHLAQVWASVAAHYYGMHNVGCWSGGTEATSFNTAAIESLRRSGFKVKIADGEVQKVELQFADDAEALVCFSKVWDHRINPQDEFAAIMVCDHADQNCPFIPNALARISLPFTDPKESDGSPEESETYDLRSRQIAEEMFWIFEQLSND